MRRLARVLAPSALAAFLCAPWLGCEQGAPPNDSPTDANNPDHALDAPDARPDAPDVPPDAPLDLGDVEDAEDAPGPSPDAGEPSDGGDAADARADADDLGAADLADAQEDAGDIAADMLEHDAAPSVGAWRALAPLPRGPRQENSVLALDGEVYVLGGFQGFQVSPLVEIYDPASERWREGEPLPVRMHHLNSTVWDGQVYVLGFLTETNFTPDGRAFRYDPRGGGWSPLASMPRGSERGAGVAAPLDGLIYVVGGLRGGAVADVSAYDPASDTWSARSPLPEPLDHLVGGVVGGVLMVAGGRDGGLRSHGRALYAYDPRRDRWEARAPMPTSRAGHSAAVWEGQLYVFGGEGNPEEASGVFDQAEVYDPASDAWSALAPMRTPRHGTGAASVGGLIYVPGGADVQGFGAVDTFEAFEPPR